MDWSQGYTLLFFLLLIVVAVWIVRYFWRSYKEPAYNPPWWREALEAGEISARLLALEKSYPDKVRFQNFWLQVQRLRKLGVEGDMAELGVYKGESAALLHAMDPSRTLHLFDTFSGFIAEELKPETGKAAEYSERSFADTKLQSVLEYVDGGEKVIAHPGKFPDAAPVSGLSFCLVNIDVDLYIPTKAGLEYFYPLLNPGGVILVHDYSPDWLGVVNAVDDFLQRTDAHTFLLPDQDATKVIVKPPIRGNGNRNQAGK